MNLLLDTQSILWFLTGNKRLSKPAKNAIENIENNCFLSIASVWEITIKKSLGKLDFDISIADFLETVSSSKIDLLPISTEHLLQLSKLKFHHRDPFDRLIISQAIVEKYTLISLDEHFHSYKVKLLW